MITNNTKDSLIIIDSGSGIEIYNNSSGWFSRDYANSPIESEYISFLIEKLEFSFFVTLIMQSYQSTRLCSLLDLSEIHRLCWQINIISLTHSANLQFTLITSIAFYTELANTNKLHHQRLVYYFHQKSCFTRNSP